MEQAALLYAIGREPNRCEWDGEQMLWIFSADEETQRSLDMFIAGDCDVLIRCDLAFLAFRKARSRFLSERNRRDGGIHPRRLAVPK
jgi:hypothetical protein